jgi:hypothetical protein
MYLFGEDSVQARRNDITRRSLFPLGNKPEAVLEFDPEIGTLFSFTLTKLGTNANRTNAGRKQVFVSVKLR